MKMEGLSNVKKHKKLLIHFKTLAYLPIQFKGGNSVSSTTPLLSWKHL